VLLATAMADRVGDPDGRRVRRIAAPDPQAARSTLVGQVDAGLPRATRFDIEDEIGPDDNEPGAETGDDGDEGRHPFITDGFLADAVADILDRYGTAFGAAWHADPERLRTEAVALLLRFGAVIAVPGGVLVRPLVGRYRHTVAKVRQRALF
jgi:hypothetical protein